MRAAHDSLAVLVLSVGLLTTFGCATGGGLGGGSSAQADQVAELQRELTAARQRAVMAEVEVRRLRERLADVEQRLAVASTPPPAPERVAIDEPSSVDSPIALPGQGRDIEETEIEVPPVAPSAPPPTPPSTAPIVSEAPVADSAPPVTTGSEAAPSAGAQALYDQGYAAFHQHRYADAESRFREFLQLYPDHGLADNAQFWIGESRYARGDFSSALAAFSATVERYPTGNKVGDAMLKAGKCLESMGQIDEAIATYEAIEVRFPGTVIASKAASQRAKLRRR